MGRSVSTSASASADWLFVIFFYPKRKGMPLEAIREVFIDGFGVRYSKRWQNEHKHDAN